METRPSVLLPILFPSSSGNWPDDLGPSPPVPFLLSFLSSQLWRVVKTCPLLTPLISVFLSSSPLLGLEDWFLLLSDPVALLAWIGCSSSSSLAVASPSPGTGKPCGLWWSRASSLLASPSKTHWVPVQPVLLELLAPALMLHASQPLQKTVN